MRYREAVGDECLVIIVSEDGMINLLTRPPGFSLRAKSGLDVAAMEP